jgi:hypothetical protein
MADCEPEKQRVNGLDDYIHVSSLIRDCPRKIGLQLSGQEGIPSIPSSADRVMWAIGRAAEQHVRKQFITAVRGEGVLGVWTCKCEATSYTGEFRHRTICHVCKGVPFTYSEMVLRDENLRIVGSPDFVFSLQDGRKRVLEIKSKSKKLYDALTGPEIEHVHQATMYHPLLSSFLGGEGLADEVGILYVCKDYAFSGVPYKLYIIKMTDASVQMALEGFRNKAAAIWDSVRQQRTSLHLRLPAPLPACSTSLATTPKNCLFSTPCFSCRPQSSVQ